MAGIQLAKKKETSFYFLETGGVSLALCGARSGALLYHEGPWMGQELGERSRTITVGTIYQGEGGSMLGGKQRLSEMEFEEMAGVLMFWRCL